jgi:hypothetical protein
MIYGVLVVTLALAPVVRGQSADSKFHQAYFLENEKGDFAAAARVYEDVAADRKADAKLRGKAKARAAACREELASADFAKLMPPNALVYAEFSRPGAQLSRLLDMLGLLREDGSLAADPERRLAISPALIREVLGIRGAAVAVTGFDPQAEEPMGVAILHPGDIGVIRGVIETALPAGAEIVGPIEGFPTYLVEDEVYVTLTARLVVVSTERSEIEGVAWRLKGEESDSLATNAELAEVLGQRDESLLFFCVNFKPVMPLINAGMAAAGSQCREAAVAQALLDLNSLRSLVGRMGVNNQGIYLDAALQLDEGHKNLAFQFVRMPAINRETLQRVPAGAAGFVAGALNEAGKPLPRTPSTEGETPPVTALDIGREIFANIVSFAVFAVPTREAVPTGGEPIPPVAAVFTVRDSARSLALWNQALGIASLASAGGALDGMKAEIEGVAARRFTFPEGISVYVAGAGNDVVISPSRAAIARSLGTSRGGKSILSDPTFSKSLSRLGPDATFVLFAHPGRCAKLAEPFMHPREVEEIRPFVGMLTDTVASVVMEHSDNTLKFSAMVTGLPDVGPFISKMITHEQQREGRQRRMRAARAQGDWDTVLKTVREARTEQPSDPHLLWEEFKILAAGKGDHEAAAALAEKLFQTLRDDASALNEYAWDLLTEDEFGQHYSKLALKLSQRSNELTKHKNWMFVDTLALALFKTGDTSGAIEMEKKALALVGDSSRRDEVEAALKRFEAALQQ